MKYDNWYMTYDIWFMLYDMWYMTYVVWWSLHLQLQFDQDVVKQLLELLQGLFSASAQMICIWKISLKVCHFSSNANFSTNSVWSSTLWVSNNDKMLPYWWLKQHSVRQQKYIDSSRIHLLHFPVKFDIYVFCFELQIELRSLCCRNVNNLRVL